MPNARNPLAEKLITVPLDPNEYDGMFDGLSDDDLLNFTSWATRQTVALDALSRRAMAKVGG